MNTTYKSSTPKTDFTKQKTVNKQLAFMKRKAANAVVYVLLFLIALTMVLPFVHELAKSFSMPDQVEAGKVNLVPKNLTGGNYFYFWRKQRAQLGRAFLNTIIVVVVGVFWGVFNTILLAFPLSRPRHEFKWGTPIMIMVIFSFVFQRPLIPYFLTVKSYGLMNSLGSLIFTHSIVPFYLFLMITALRELPEELFDACRIDGGNEFHLFFYVVIPLSKAILATVAIFLGVQLYNLYMHPILFIHSSKVQVLQPIVRSIMRSSGDVLAGSILDQDPFKETESVKSALIILTILPILVVYPFMQKFFTKGTMVGAVKT